MNSFEPKHLNILDIFLHDLANFGFISHFWKKELSWQKWCWETGLTNSWVEKMSLLSTSEEIGHFLKHRALSTKLGILTESIILQNFKIQNIAKCTISTFKCTKKFQNTPVKIYRTSDRTYVPKKNRVSLYFWFTTLWMKQIIRLIGSWLNIERSSRSWHLALRTYGG